MKLPDIFANRHFKWVAILIAIIALFFFVMNVFIIGGDSFIYLLNSSSNVPLMVCVTLSAVFLLFRIGDLDRSRILWRGLVIGWVLWTLAESIWLLYSINAADIPYPSLADFFWVVGYIPISLGLFTRIRSMPVRLTRNQQILLTGLLLGIISTTVILIFIPIIQYFDPTRLIESLLNLFYPLADLFLMSLVLRLFFSYEKGALGLTWQLLLIGFITMTFSDLLFTYADWRELYYPDSRANFISRLMIDFPYTVSFLFWFLGISAMHILSRKHITEEQIIQPTSVPVYEYSIVYTNKSGMITGIKTSIKDFFASENMLGKSFVNAFSITPYSQQGIFEKLRRDGKINDMPLQVCDRSGIPHEIRLNGLALYGPEKDYWGANFLLLIADQKRPTDPAFDKESRSMVHYLLEQTGSRYIREISQLLIDYHLVFIRSISNLLVHQGGDRMTQLFIDQMQEYSKNRGWKFLFNQNTILNNADYPLELLREALPLLVRNAETFAAKVMDPRMVSAHMRMVESQINETVKNDARRYMKTGSEYNSWE